MGIGFYSPYSLYGDYSALYGMPLPSCKDTKSTARFLILQKFINIFCERFKYKNLPDDMKKISGKNNILELMLFFAPSVAWFKDDRLGLQVLPTTGEYDYTITGMPTAWTVKGANGYSKRLTQENSVIMFNDNAYTIPFLHVMYDAFFMVEADETHRQEFIAHRMPVVLEMEEDEKKSAEKFIREVQSFKDTIKVRKRDGGKLKDKNPFSAQVLRLTEREFEGKVYMDDYKEFENRILTYFGINNVQIEKRERLLTGEISANDMLIQMNYTSALSTRKEAIEAVNKMFNVNISVEENELFALQAQNLNTQQQQFGGNVNVDRNKVFAENTP